MPQITPHESDAEFFTPEDVDKDFASLRETLLEKQLQNFVRELARRSEVYVALRKLASSGRFANEVEALAHAVRSLQSTMPAEQNA